MRRSTLSVAGVVSRKHRGSAGREDFKAGDSSRANRAARALRMDRQAANPPPPPPPPPGDECVGGFYRRIQSGRAGEAKEWWQTARKRRSGSIALSFGYETCGRARQGTRG